MKIFLDTNVLLRFFLGDVEEQFKETEALLGEIEAGRHRVYTSSIVLLEIAYVASKLYKMPHKDVVDVLEAVRQIRGLTVIERTDSERAIKLWKKHKIKLADCLIASQVPTDMVVVSYDKELAKLPVKTMAPGDVA